jgi:hypothetical protein
MTEPPHPHMPGGSNAFHPPGGHPWGTASSPWMHYHHAYNTHWRGYGCGRARGRLLFFMLGAGAATLFFKWKCHGEEWLGSGSGGNGGRFRRQERVEYPDGAADSAGATTSNRAEEEDQRPRWAHKAWAWRGENRRAPPHDPAQAPADSPAAPASNSRLPTPPVSGNNTHAEPGSTYTWKWDQDAIVKSATGTVSYSSVSLVSFFPCRPLGAEGLRTDCCT